MKPTLIFDCDGVLADTERFGHLPAFNQTFEHFGLPVRWTEDDYAEKLKIGGGKERMQSLLTPEFIAQARLPTEPARLAEHVARWHRHKTDLYCALVDRGALPARPGIARLIDLALREGWVLAVASTSALSSVQAVLRIAAGPSSAARFAGVFAGDVVPKKKPAPDIYLLALRELGADPGSTLVIEDSRNGLESARAAGLACLITVNGYTRSECFDEAVLVVEHLGDPGNPARVIADRRRGGNGVMDQGQIGLSDLHRCFPG